MEKVDDFHQRLLGLVLTGHVGEGNAGGFFHVDLGVGLAHAAHTAHAAHPAHEEEEQAHHQAHGHHIAQQQTHEVGGLLHHLRVELHVVLPQQGDQVGVLLGEGSGDVAGGPALFHLLGQDLGQILAVVRRVFGQVLLQVKGVLVAGQLDRCHLVLFHHLDKFGIGDLHRAGVGDLPRDKVNEDHQDHGPQDGPDEGAALFRGPGAAGIAFVLIGVQQYLPSCSGCRHTRFWFMSFAGLLSPRSRRLTSGRRQTSSIWSLCYHISPFFSRNGPWPGCKVSVNGLFPRQAYSR